MWQFVTILAIFGDFGDTFLTQNCPKKISKALMGFWGLKNELIIVATNLAIFLPKVDDFFFLTPGHTDHFFEENPFLTFDMTAEVFLGIKFNK